MKILHIIDSGGLYGAEMMLLSLMLEQKTMGQSPILASVGSSSVAEKAIESEAHKLGLRVEIFRFANGPNLIGALKILRFARRCGADIIHSHGYKGNILLGLLPRRFRRTPMITTVHGWTWTGGLSRMGIYEWLDGVSLRFLDRVVLVNSQMLSHPRLKNKRNLQLEVVDNGISALSFVAAGCQSQEPSPEIVSFCQKRFTIGAIGRFSPEKGFNFLLEAVATLISNGEDVQLLLLGEGSLRKELEEQVRELGLNGRIMMPGYISNARMYLPYLQVFALPSLTEGLPIVILEAMAAGVPIVASKVGGVPAALEQGAGGYLTEPGSVDSLLAGICAVIQNPDQAARRVQISSQRVRSEYSSQAMAEKYQAIYQDVLLPSAN